MKLVKTFVVLMMVFAAVQISRSNAHAQAQDLGENFTTRDNVLAIPYRAFGPAFYSKTLNYPVIAPWFSYPHLSAHKIALMNASALNPGADETGWVPVPVKDGAVYYRAEYHLKDIADVSIESDIRDAIAIYADSKVSKRTSYAWQPTESQQAEFKQKAKMHAVVYSADQFRAQFFPGTTLLTQQDGMMKGAKLGYVRGAIRMKPSYSRVTKEYGQVAGVFKATFDNFDCVREGRFPGMIIDGQTIDAPLANLATLATYNDGSFRIAPYSKLPREGIQMLRQNEFPVLENGELNIAGAYPVRWNRFEDNIMRSYMFMSADGKYFGYVWTNYAHPSFLAKVMKKLGFSEMMLMDIHPAFVAGVRKPINRGDAVPEFFSNGSYPLVPLESEVISWGISAVAQLARGGAEIQWNYKSAASGTPNDFMAVFMK